MRTLTLAAVVLALAACSSERPAAQAPTVRTATAAPTRTAFRGGNAITQSETPHDQLLAQARSTGRPAVLFFWTSW